MNLKLKTIIAILAIISLALFSLACGKAPETGTKKEAAKPVQDEAVSVPAISQAEKDTDEPLQEDMGTAEESEEDTAIDAGDEMSIADGNIPKGYPIEEFPPYKLETSHVLGGFHQSMEGTEMYNLVIGTHDDVQTVSPIINDYYRDNSQKFESMSSDLLLGEKGGWEYAIVINDGEADGYGTLVTYTLTKQL